MNGKTRNVLLACFFLSGAAGLVYEVVWSRQLTLFIGVTTFAHTAVITAYMLGLALGSYFVGRFSDRHASPLRLFVWLELAVAAYAVATPWLLEMMAIVYAKAAVAVGVTGLASHMARFLFAVLLLLPPTIVMGGTLPVMVRGLSRLVLDTARNSGLLYGVNTLGAVAGAIAAGYLLLPVIGVRGSILAGALVDVVVALTVLCLSRNVADANDRLDATPEMESPSATDGSPRFILSMFALSGFSAMVYQVAWIRALTMVLGSSVFSFTITVAAFLTGIGVGSLLFRWAQPAGGRTRQLLLASIATGAAALSALCSFWLIGRLPELFLWGFRFLGSGHFLPFQAYTFCLGFLVMSVPTVLLGAMFPLVISVVVRQNRSIGRDVGMVYGANTAGCIAGTLAGGLLLIPQVGVQGAVVVAVVLHVLAGIGYVLRAGVRSSVKSAVIASLLACLSLAWWWIPAWDREIMTTGVFNYAQGMTGGSVREAVRARAGMFTSLYYKEGRDGTVTVFEREGQRMLAINGKIDASTRSDLSTQIMVGQLPLMMHPAPENVLIIGLGSGITAGAVAVHPGVKRIDIVEISPEVVEASAFFSAENREVLRDPRVHLVVADARNFLLANDRTYDVIVTQPSNPWISGVANLFTRDFFDLLRNRLAPGGIVSQWFHIYNMSVHDTRSVMRSYQDVFPCVTAWLSMNVDIIMLGSVETHELEASRFLRLEGDPATKSLLGSVNMHGLDRVAKMFLFGDKSFRTYGAGAAPNTDDRPRVEFSAPRYLYEQTTEATLRDMIGHTLEQPVDVPIAGIAQRRDDRLVAPASHLSVRAEALPEPGTWSAAYRTWRRVIDREGSGIGILGVGGEMVMTWRDDATSNRVISFHAEQDKSIDQLNAYLRALRSSETLLAGGEVDMPTGVRGVWLISKDDQRPDHATITITWMEPSADGGYFQRVAEREQEISHDTNVWGEALLAFVRCFPPATEADIFR